MHTRNHSSQRSIKSRKLLCRDFARICARIHRHPLQPRIVPRNGSNPVNYPNVHRTLENSWRIRCWTLGEILSLSLSLSSFLSLSLSLFALRSYILVERSREESMAAHCCGDRVHGKDTARTQCVPAARRQNAKRNGKKKEKEKK